MSDDGIDIFGLFFYLLICILLGGLLVKVAVMMFEWALLGK